MAPPIVADPNFPAPTQTQNVFLAGIGGTGIVTVNQVLATAALRGGLEVESLDQIGLSQKAGPVVSHLRFGPRRDRAVEPADPGIGGLHPGLRPAHRGRQQEPRPTARRRARSPSRRPAAPRPVTWSTTRTSPTRTRQIWSTGCAPPPARSRRSTRWVPPRPCSATPRAANFLLVGAAFQSGGLRIPASAIEEAIEINGVAVASNLAAFKWGRAAIAAPTEFAAAIRPADERPEPQVPVGAVRRQPAHRRGPSAGGTARSEARRVPVPARSPASTSTPSPGCGTRSVPCTERTEFSEAVAKGLFKLTAYKDEYEVARMLVDPAFLADVSAQVPGGEQLTYKLHPPVLKAMGRKKKIGFGPKSHVALKLLAKGKKLRGTKLDPFGQRARARGRARAARPLRGDRRLAGRRAGCRRLRPRRRDRGAARHGPRLRGGQARERRAVPRAPHRTRGGAAGGLIDEALERIVLPANLPRAAGRTMRSSAMPAPAPQREHTETVRSEQRDGRRRSHRESPRRRQCARHHDHHGRESVGRAGVQRCPAALLDGCESRGQHRQTRRVGEALADSPQRAADQDRPQRADDEAAGDQHASDSDQDQAYRSRRRPRGQFARRAVAAMP